MPKIFTTLDKIKPAYDRSSRTPHGLKKSF